MILNCLCLPTCWGFRNKSSCVGFIWCWESKPGHSRQAFLPTELHPRHLMCALCMKCARVQVPVPVFAFAKAKTEHLIRKLTVLAGVADQPAHRTHCLCSVRVMGLSSTYASTGDLNRGSHLVCRRVLTYPTKSWLD